MVMMNILKNLLSYLQIWDIKPRGAINKNMAIEHDQITAPVQQLWKESYIALGEIEVPMGIIIDDPWRDIANFIMEQPTSKINEIIEMWRTYNKSLI